MEYSAKDFAAERNFRSTGLRLWTRPVVIFAHNYRLNSLQLEISSRNCDATAQPLLHLLDVHLLSTWNGLDFGGT